MVSFKVPKVVQTNTLTTSWGDFKSGFPRTRHFVSIRALNLELKIPTLHLTDSMSLGKSLGLLSPPL